MDNLKPCPFCGGEAVFRNFDDGSGGIRCSRCNFTPLIHASYGREKSKQKAIAEWNRRPDLWIPITERLPEKGECLVVYSDGTVHIASVIFGEDFKHCTHWMPLPEPPKEERAVG